ncbi:MotA/TolQ/ExbB proton channel family protein [Neorhodopirellula lusitana]|uniref:MotA/TolQ/ExbB proton channel family protein n=1 Tax=Neorhodopirellula lusitana TaxID=445327 RepID=A0ABY1PVY3_9BACT|nr:MotA/TolQ/ExbB proton channel family protein [Neorhodopirellula lusitana]SMP50525.1 MotA/TolQ/ExbB proton channel family protein [Neorhodopirellula lusitana]
MSYFTISCPGCKKHLKVRDALAGKSRACPHCRVSFRVPDSASDSKVTPATLNSTQTPTKPQPSPTPDTGLEINTQPKIDTSGTTKPKPVKHHRTAKKGWFDSSSESASSDVSLVLSGILGAVMTVLWFALLYPFQDNYFGALFWQRGPVPFPTTFLMFWAVAILILKWRRLQEQRNAMLLDVLPLEVSSEITFGSIDEFIGHINDLPGASSDSFLINRVVRGIEHFRVRKSAAETATMMESQSAIDANNIAGSYTILKVFIWALPILGFIGTVMGVSSAVASLASSLAGGGSMDAMKSALQDVFGGLGTAFDTTLLALIMSMLVKIPASALQKSEEDLITNVDEYCNENLLRRLNDDREGGAERSGSGGTGSRDTKIFRDAVEQALGTQHAEMERWLEKLDAIGARMTKQVSQGWDEVNDRIESQQEKHVQTLHTQQLDQQANLQAQLDQMANAADKIQSTLNTLAEQTASMQTQVNDTFAQTHNTLREHLGGVQTGLSSLSQVLENLGEHQVVIQQVESNQPRRAWFGGRGRRSRNGRA